MKKPRRSEAEERHRRTLVIIVSVATMHRNLSAEFASGKIHGVKVGIRSALPDSAKRACQIAGRYPLTRRSGNVGGGDGALKRTGGRRRTSGLAVAAAQENHHPASHMIFTKMEVRQNRIARQIRERHFEIYRAVRVDGCLERGCAIAN